MIGGSQKGLQLPPGIGINALSERALDANARAKSHRSYWDWMAMIEANRTGFFPYTPPTNMLFAFDVALDLLLDEGMELVIARHRRHASATRTAVEGWGLDIQCERADEYSPSLTAVRFTGDTDAEKLGATIAERFNTSVGAGLGPLRGRVLRIGHLGSLNDPMLIGALGAIECGLISFGCEIASSGTANAVRFLSATPK